MQTRESIRTFIKNLGDVPNYSVKISKSLLEEALFKKVKSKTGKVGKLLVWSGEFLIKVDLSEISFSNVIWNPIAPYLCDEEYFGADFKDIQNYFKDLVKRREYWANLKDTNVKIDFLKSFEAQERTLGHDFIEKTLYGVILTNVNLAFANCDSLDNTILSDLQLTNAKISFSNYHRYIMTNFTGLDFKNITVDEQLLQKIYLCGCSLFMSGIKFSPKAVDILDENENNFDIESVGLAKK